MTIHGSLHTVPTGLRCLSWLLLCLLSNTAWAVNAADLARFEQRLWEVRSDAHAYLVLDNAPRYRSATLASIQALRHSLEQLQDGATGSEQSLLANRVAPKLRQYLSAADTSVRTGDEPKRQYAVQDLTALSYEIAALVAPLSADGDNSDPIVALLRTAAQVQHIGSEYLSLVASPAGGMAIGGEGNIDLNEAVPAMDRHLQTLKRRLQEPSATEALAEAEGKWRFIRESLMKFYDKSVPFLVQRYTEQIVDALQRGAV